MKTIKPRHILLLTVIFCLLFLLNPLPSLNYILQDLLFCRPDKAQSNIFVIGIDDRSLNSIGSWNSWERSTIAEAINLLNADEKNRPLCIGIDIMYFGESNNDDELIEASAKWDNLVFASKLKISNALELKDNGTYESDKLHLDGIELPITSISSHAQSGFTNVVFDGDGFVRRALLFAETEQTTYQHFAYSVYETYAKNAGITPVVPQMDKNHIYMIPYGADNGDFYSGLSFIDVLEGKIPLELFKDSIVLIGAYAPGMLDSYHTPVSRSTPMHGVELNANIVQALCQNKSIQNVPTWAQLLIMSFLLSICFYFYQKQTIIKNTALLLSTGGYLLLTALLAERGYLFDPLYLPLMSVILYIYTLVHSYMNEQQERMKTFDTLKRYVSPEVAGYLMKQGNSAAGPKSSRRHIAVMFVDIRGFTPLSESLDPEAVADILNEYLTLTSSAILRNGGTVDKFIGDATMAIFNAPANLDDYLYQAVKTALEIAAGGDALSKTSEAKYGKEVRFGIGINCGDAVVGSIGADFRMDYTAIGDTVNTAARLESNAGKGQILVSDAVFHSLKDRVQFTYIGEILLKGKNLPVRAYQADRLI